MSLDNWSHLQESDIDALATSKVFARGRTLFDEGALEDLTRQDTPQGKQLVALCQGSEGDSYSLSARLNELGVQETHCTCPYDHDGLCKHLVALLLTWAHTPESFEEAIVSSSAPTAESALFRELQTRKKDELAHLIVQLVEAEPKLRALVKRLLQSRLSDAEVAKTERAVATQLRKAARAGSDVNFSQIRRELLFHLRGAASLEPLRPGDAMRLYVAIIRGMMAAGNNPYEWDEDGYLVGVSQDCVAALATLLPRVSASLRQSALQAICEAYLFDHELGGCDFAGGAEEILEAISVEDWPPIQAQLDTYIQHDTPSRGATIFFGSPGMLHDYLAEYSKWGCAKVVALQARRIARLGDPQAANIFLIQNGTPEQQVDAHLANRDFEVAVRLANQHLTRHGGLMRAFAEKLNDAGEWVRAREWAEEHGMVEWLARQSALRHEPDALSLSIKLFEIAPSVTHWFQAMEMVRGSERTNLETQLWQLLEQNKAYVTQFDIRLREGNVMAALDIWPKLRHGERSLRHDQLATAAESCDVDIAVLLWRELAESLINHRSRDAYRLAAKALLRAKRLLEKVGRGSEWPAMGSAVRTSYPTLRALKEELDRAKL